jgi:hypothetical protein
MRTVVPDDPDKARCYAMNCKDRHGEFHFLGSFRG